MQLTFIETPLFSRLLPDYLDDEAYRTLQQALLVHPESGNVIPGTGGFRKIRWHDTRRGKGTRGGLRLIYFYLKDDQQLWFFTIYGKDEVTDLTPEEKRILKRAMRSELSYRQKRK